MMINKRLINEMGILKIHKTTGIFTVDSTIM